MRKGYNDTPMEKLHISKIKVGGMHCPSCDILVKTTLEDTGNIVKVEPDHKQNIVTIYHHGKLSHNQLNAALCQYGYEVKELDDTVDEQPFMKRLTDALIVAGIFAILYYFAVEFKLLPDTMGGAVSSIWGAFILGLVASASTCMATTGTLFTSFLHKQKERGQAPRLALLFMAGRLISYALFGYVFGLFGQGLGYVTSWGATLNLIVAVFLIIAGLDMLKLVSLSQILDILNIYPTRWFSLGKRSGIINTGAFGLGFVTFFLPCGFTISTLAYALSSGNPLYSSQIMTAFALGTIPSLIFLTVLAHIRNNTFYQYFLKVVGVMVIAVGLSYVWTALSVNGLLPSNTVSDKQFDGVTAEIVNGKQYVHMTASAIGYTPNQFIVKKGIPVKWTVDGKDVYGCQGSLQAPQAGIQITYLEEGKNEFEFIPKEVGYINFSCSMGMFSGIFKVIEG